MQDYQKALKDCADLKAEYERSMVEKQYMEIQVQMLTLVTQELKQQYETLVDEKKIAEGRNEELRTKAKGDAEVANKRLQQKLQREKSQTLKNLLADEEMTKQYEEEMSLKLRSEMESFDKLHAEKLLLCERLARKKKDLDDDTEVVSAQEEEIKRLKELIAAE